jgi:signal transduction histidine kinase
VISDVVTFYDDTSIITFIFDLTQEKLIEDELKKREKQIVSTQKMELLGTFARGLTHDFKGILSMISLNIDYIETLLKDEEPIEEELLNIQQNIVEVDKLIQGLIGFQKSEDVVSKLFSPFVELSEFLVWIDKLIGKNHVLQINYADPNVLIKGNPDQFKQVLLNLIANARDAMPNGGIINIDNILIKIESNKIINPEAYEFGLNRVFWHIDLEDGDKLLISVKDNGTGIDKNIIDQIFETFFTTKESGTGIGLSMVKSIVDSMGGKISVESIKNEGTIFYIILPVSSLGV